MDLNCALHGVMLPGVCATYLAGQAFVASSKGAKYLQIRHTCHTHADANGIMPSYTWYTTHICKPTRNRAGQRALLLDNRHLRCLRTISVYVQPNKINCSTENATGKLACQHVRQQITTTRACACGTPGSQLLACTLTSRHSTRCTPMYCKTQYFCAQKTTSSTAQQGRQYLTTAAHRHPLLTWRMLHAAVVHAQLQGPELVINS